MTEPARDLVALGRVTFKNLGRKLPRSFSFKIDPSSSLTTLIKHLHSLFTRAC